MVTNSIRTQIYQNTRQFEASKRTQFRKNTRQFEAFIFQKIPVSFELKWCDILPVGIVRLLVCLSSFQNKCTQRQLTPFDYMNVSSFQVHSK